jgi:signal transduction histidine kinase
LVWLGFRVLDQDRQLERQQGQERLERSADLVIATIQREITRSEQALVTGASDWPDGVVALTVTAGIPVVRPRQRVAFLPLVPLKLHPDDRAFVEAEALQLQKHDSAGAIASLESLARSSDRGTRAGALLRLARAREAIGDTPSALRTYQQMATIDDVFIADAPASLVAAYARCRLFEAHGNRSELLSEAHRLRADLKASRWPLTAPVYWLYHGDALKWTNEHAQVSTPELLAAAVTAIWERWHDLPLSAVPAKGHDRVPVGTESLTITWIKTEDTLRVLIGTQDFVRNQWLAAAEKTAVAQGVSLSTGSAAGVEKAGSIVRTTSQSELPWPIAVRSTQRSELSSRRMLIAGFALLLAMGVVAGVATVRAVGRELAVARLQSEFVSTVSHEFRTPLTTLRQFTDRLRDNTDLAATDRTICYDAQSRATDRLTRLVESLLDFGRMQADARPYAFEPVDCADVVEHVLSDFQRSQHRLAVGISFQRNGPAPVLADREALSLAVWNLVDNAVKYAPGTTSIEVDVGHSSDHVTVAVRDHGIGIPRGEQVSIFQKFQRGQEARTRGFSGTGLGLAIVAHIVRAHRGEVLVQSTVGKGSTFTISLPSS